MPQGATFLDLAKEISEGLARQVVVATANGEVRDLRDELMEGDGIQLLKPDHPIGLDALRHSCEHILAAAVCKLFDGAQVTMGPKSHDGEFYYDFDIGRPFTPEDLKGIETEMKGMIKQKTPFSRKTVSKAEALKIFKGLAQRFKPEILEWIPSDDVTLYQCGDFLDLCRGPHIQSAGQIKAFKLTGASASYWRADASRDHLQRISGIAFASKQELADHLHRIEEAKKRDHRKLGPQLGLFFVGDKRFNDILGPGLVSWLPKGGRVRGLMEDFSKDLHYKGGYEMVYSPHVAKSELWKKSGHADFYKESMFPAMKMDEQEYLLKPMNCPFHAMMYSHVPKSYRDLPVRLAEFGTVYRYEMAGVLHGLMRVRGFTQDDAHIFCRRDQLDAEIDRVVGFVLDMLRAFGFSKFEVNLSTRPDKFVGDPKDWDAAEGALKNGIERHKLPFEVDAGGGAFYGPKIDIKLRDCLDRLWQCSTIQLDFNNPERFDLSFRNSEGEEERPFMIHRALFGSVERFMGILVEEYAGAFPMWLAPEQVRILTISDRFKEHGEKLLSALKNKGIRAEMPDQSERLGHKIRQAQLDKVPVMLVVGEKEVEEGGATLRMRDGADKGLMSEEKLMEFCLNEAKRPLSS